MVIIKKWCKPHFLMQIYLIFFSGGSLLPGHTVEVYRGKVSCHFVRFIRQLMNDHIIQCKKGQTVVCLIFRVVIF